MHFEPKAKLMINNFVIIIIAMAMIGIANVVHISIVHTGSLEDVVSHHIVLVRYGIPGIPVAK